MLLDIFRIQLVLVDELRYSDRTFGRHATVIQLAWLDDDVLAFAVPVTLNDFVLFDYMAGFRASAVYGASRPMAFELVISFNDGAIRITPAILGIKDAHDFWIYPR